MSYDSIERHAWWLAALEWAQGERGRLLPSRDLGEPLTVRPAWVLTHSRGLEMGQLGVATLIDETLRFAPDQLAPLLEALSGWRTARSLEAVAGLWSALWPLFGAWARHLAKNREVPEHLVAAALYRLGEILPADQPSEPPELARKTRATAILAYRQATTDLNRYQLGVFWAATWCTTTERSKLERMSPPFDPQRLFLDTVVLAVIACQRMRRTLAQRGEVHPPPDLAIIQRPHTPLTATVRRPTTVEELARPEPPAPEPSPAPPPSAEPFPPTPTPTPTPTDERASWWVGACDWAEDDPTQLERLLELADLVVNRPMWQLIAFELRLLDTERKLRHDELGRLALASLLLEYRRALPHRYDELLDALLPRHDRLELEDAGRLWMLFDPLFSCWAKSLAGPDLPPKLEARRLHELAQVVPWSEPSGDTEQARLRAIEAAFPRDRRPSDEASRVGTYFAALTVRNDLAHHRPQSLRGGVPPISLHRDVVAFGALAALRFRRAFNKAQVDGALTGPMSFPDIFCITAGPHRLRPSRS